MFIFTYTGAILTIICFGIAILIIKKNSNLARLLGLIVLSDAGWIGANALTDIATTRFSVVLWSGIALICGSLYIGFYLCFIEAFTNHKLSKLKLVIFFTPIAIITLFAFSKYDVGEVFFPVNEPAQFVPGILYYFSLAYCFTGLLYIAIKLAFHYQISNIKKRAQIIYLELGFFVSILGGVIFIILLPLMGELRFFNLGPQFSVFFIGFTSYAIIRHQLLDIKIVIQRGLIYSTLFSVIAVVYILGVLIVGFIFQQITNTAMVIVGILTTAAGIYGVPRLEKFFRRETDKIFFKDKYDYSEAVYSLSEILNRNINLETLLSKITDELREILKTQSVHIIMPGQKLVFSHDKITRKTKIDLPPELVQAIEVNPDTVLVLSDIPREIAELEGAKDESRRRGLEQAQSFGDQYGVEVAVAIKSSGQLSGLIALGKKMSGDYYTGEDINLLKTLACQAAVALENAQLYETVRKHSQELEKKVNERTENLKRLQEEQKQMMLEIAHGLQTPLTIIKGELSLLANQVENKKEIKHLEHTIDHVSRFIYDMLRLARQESASDVKKEKMNLSETLEDLTENIRIITGDKNIEISGQIQPGINISGDKAEIEEMIMNLSSNSLKYMKPRQRGKIVFALCRKGKQAILTISDNGIGIGAEHLPHIFTKLYRIRDESHIDKQGTGLGLAICKKIVERHGGTIKAESEVGQGTKFIISFPAL